MMWQLLIIDWINSRALKQGSHGVQADHDKEAKLKMFLMTPTIPATRPGFLTMLGRKKEKELPEKILQGSKNFNGHHKILHKYEMSKQFFFFKLVTVLASNHAMQFDTFAQCCF